jgi:hypothetical protein
VHGLVHGWSWHLRAFCSITDTPVTPWTLMVWNELAGNWTRDVVHDYEVRDVVLGYNDIAMIL